MLLPAPACLAVAHRPASASCSASMPPSNTSAAAAAAGGSFRPVRRHAERGAAGRRPRRAAATPAPPADPLHPRHPPPPCPARRAARQVLPGGRAAGACVRPPGAGTRLASPCRQHDSHSLTGPCRIAAGPRIHAVPHPPRRPACRPAAARRSAGRRRRAAAQVRIKDIADVEGVRENQLVGYGLVVGLNGTGDRLDNAVFTRESLIGMLERLGVNTRDQVGKLQTKNVAAVMVTAEPARLRPHRQPDRRRGLRARRCQGPDRRHAAGHPPAGRRRRGLRGRPGHAGHRRDRRPRRRRLGHPRRAHRRAHRQRRHRRDARSATSSPPTRRSASACATPT